MEQIQQLDPFKDAGLAVDGIMVLKPGPPFNQEIPHQEVPALVGILLQDREDRQ